MCRNVCACVRVAKAYFVHPSINADIDMLGNVLLLISMDHSLCTGCLLFTIEGKVVGFSGISVKFCLLILNLH